MEGNKGKMKGKLMKKWRRIKEDEGKIKKNKKIKEKWMENEGN